MNDDNFRLRSRSSLFAAETQTDWKQFSASFLRFPFFSFVRDQPIFETGIALGPSSLSLVMDQDNANFYSSKEIEH